MLNFHISFVLLPMSTIKCQIRCQKYIPLNHITYRSFPHRCHQSSQVSGHTSRPGGCISRLHTQTLKLHTWERFVGEVGWHHMTPWSRPIRPCSLSVHRTACDREGRHQTGHRRRSQWCSSGRNPHRSRHRSRLHRCIRDVQICNVCCGMQIHLSYTSHDL